MAQRGLLDAEKEDPFSLFVSSTNIRYCFYHDTQNILGNTFGMCVLQVMRGGLAGPGRPGLAPQRTAHSAAPSAPLHLSRAALLFAGL
jgi:hypothetical protein